MIGGADVPYLPRGVRSQYDAVRETDVLLGPERVLMLDPIGKAILDRLDGEASVLQVSEGLSATYDAPLDVIAPDVTAFVTDLVEKGFVHVRRP